MSAEVEWWWSIGASAMDSALSCCLIPHGWLPGENPVLAPLSPDGRWRLFSVASLLEDVVLRRSVTLSGGQSGVNLLPVLCVDAVGVWVAYRY
uniref:Uncharacterized protein n=1 Tax=Oryza rufipogon TaxID=4529 RepID=A0A0E0PZS2_ORYRU